jgi:hypothetical protein
MNERWVCKRCFTSVDGSQVSCPNCGLARGSEVPAGAWSPGEGATPGPPAAPARRSGWQGLLRFWWIPVVVIVAASALFFSARRDDSGAISGAGTLTVSDLRVGDCFNLQDEDEELIGEVDAKPCTEPHIYEMYFVGDMPDGDFPGQAAMDQFAADQCLPAFEEFVGLSYQESILEIFYLTPSEESWDAGDLAVQCAVHHPALETVSESYRNSRQ